MNDDRSMMLLLIGYLSSKAGATSESPIVVSREDFVAFSKKFGGVVLEKNAQGIVVRPVLEEEAQAVRNKYKLDKDGVVEEAAEGVDMLLNALAAAGVSAVEVHHRTDPTKPKHDFGPTPDLTEEQLRQQES